jgi:hypothetical protein
MRKFVAKIAQIIINYTMASTVRLSGAVLKSVAV